MKRHLVDKNTSDVPPNKRLRVTVKDSKEGTAKTTESLVKESTTKTQPVLENHVVAASVATVCDKKESEVDTKHSVGDVKQGQAKASVTFASPGSKYCPRYSSSFHFGIVK